MPSLIPVVCLRGLVHKSKSSGTIATITMDAKQDQTNCSFLFMTPLPHFSTSLSFLQLHHSPFHPSSQKQSSLMKFSVGLVVAVVQGLALVVALPSEGSPVLEKREDTCHSLCLREFNPDVYCGTSGWQGSCRNLYQRKLRDCYRGCPIP